MDALGPRRLSPPAALSGGGGLVGTAADYHRFVEMLRRGGEFEGVRLLGSRTVDYMTTNHLPGGVDLEEFGRPLFSETTFDGTGFGLGFAVVDDPVKGKVLGTPGTYHWGGAASTAFWVDPGRGDHRAVPHPAPALEHPPDPLAAQPARLPGPGRLTGQGPPGIGPDGEAGTATRGRCSSGWRSAATARASSASHASTTSAVNRGLPI